jgi:hypothetical protein
MFESQGIVEMDFKVQTVTKFFKQRLMGIRRVYPIPNVPPIHKLAQTMLQRYYFGNILPRYVGPLLMKALAYINNHLQIQIQIIP